MRWMTWRAISTRPWLTVEDLSPEERRAFERAAAAGDLSHMVEPWCAWWTLSEARDIALGRDGTRVVAEVGGSGGGGGGGGTYAFSGDALAVVTETPGDRHTGGGKPWRTLLVTS